MITDIKQISYFEEEAVRRVTEIYKNLEKTRYEVEEQWRKRWKHANFRLTTSKVKGKSNLFIDITPQAIKQNARRISSALLQPEKIVKLKTYGNPDDSLRAGVIEEVLDWAKEVSNFPSKLRIIERIRATFGVVCIKTYWKEQWKEMDDLVKTSEPYLDEITGLESQRIVIQTQRQLMKVYNMMELEPRNPFSVYYDPTIETVSEMPHIIDRQMVTWKDLMANRKQTDEQGITRGIYWLTEDMKKDLPELPTKVGDTADHHRNMFEDAGWKYEELMKNKYEIMELQGRFAIPKVTQVENTISGEMDLKVEWDENLEADFIVTILNRSKLIRFERLDTPDGEKTWVIAPFEPREQTINGEGLAEELFTNQLIANKVWSTAIDGLTKAMKRIYKGIKKMIENPEEVEDDTKSDDVIAWVNHPNALTEFKRDTSFLEVAQSILGMIKRESEVTSGNTPSVQGMSQHLARVATANQNDLNESMQYYNDQVKIAEVHYVVPIFQKMYKYIQKYFTLEDWFKIVEQRAMYLFQGTFDEIPSGLVQLSPEQQMAFRRLLDKKNIYMMGDYDFIPQASMTFMSKTVQNQQMMFLLEKALQFGMQGDYRGAFRKIWENFGFKDFNEIFPDGTFQQMLPMGMNPMVGGSNRPENQGYAGGANTIPTRGDTEVNMAGNASRIAEGIR